jgi:hypothetical protein
VTKPTEPQEPNRSTPEPAGPDASITGVGPADTGPGAAVSSDPAAPVTGAEPAAAAAPDEHANGVSRPAAGTEPPEVAEPAAGARPVSLADAETVQVRAPRGESGEGRTNGHSSSGALPPPWQRVPVGSAATATAAPKAAAAGSAEDLSGPPTMSMEQPTTHLRAPGGEREPDDGAGTTPGGFTMSWPRNRRPRQAALQLKRLDPWSVLKVALVLAVVLYLVWLVAVGVLYGVLDGIGVWDRLNGQYADLVSDQGGNQLISAGRVFGVAAVLGAVNSLLFAVALSVGAFVYNVSADLVGGVEVTLSERD